MRDSVYRKYSKEWLQYERPQPMFDSDIQKFFVNFYKNDLIEIDDLVVKFKEQFQNWLINSKRNKLTGFESFPNIDIIYGCTQFIDNLYMLHGKNIKIVKGDYKYHWRLNNNIEYLDINLDLIKNINSESVLIISLPFPLIGNIHTRMQEILDNCYACNIDVHVDGAWVGCARNLEFNYNHPAIKSIGFSLSKCGLGNNRIGIRMSREKTVDSISLMNDFNMHHYSIVKIGSEFLETFPPDYFWDKYEEKYNKVILDFNLIPTNAIHLAIDKDTGYPVGIRPLLRAL